MSKFMTPGPLRPVSFLHRIYTSGVKIKTRLKKIKVENVKADTAKITILCENNYNC